MTRVPYSTCFVPIPRPGIRFMLVPCGDRTHKARRCREHYLDWRNARETRRGTEHRSHKHESRRELCAENGVANTGRQWRQLRKRLARAERAA